MGRGKKSVLLIRISTVFVIEGLMFLTGILVQSVWLCVVALATVVFWVYFFFYVILFQRKEARYPIVSPEEKTDICFPRTNIPRPVHEDFRKMQ